MLTNGHATAFAAVPRNNIATASAEAHRPDFNSLVWFQHFAVTWTFDLLLPTFANMPQTPPRKRRSDIVVKSPYFSPKASHRSSLTIDQLHERLIQLKPCLIQGTFYVSDSLSPLLKKICIRNRRG